MPDSPMFKTLQTAFTPSAQYETLRKRQKEARDRFKRKKEHQPKPKTKIGLLGASIHINGTEVRSHIWQKHPLAENAHLASCSMQRIMALCDEDTLTATVGDLHVVAKRVDNVVVAAACLSRDSFVKQIHRILRNACKRYAKGLEE